MALRRGFTRYALSIQYHGSSFLGFPYLKEQENAILPDGTDLRGFFSVEGRLRQALDAMLVGQEVDTCYENIQVSSRTDRGVHALKNTCQVDMLHKADGSLWPPEVLKRGLNYYLARQGSEEELGTIEERRLYRRAKRKLDNWSFHSPMNELRILNAIQAPLTLIKNEYHQHDPTQPAQVEWNVRFSATQRTYVYRILASNADTGDWALPFEWDRSWRVSPIKGAARDETYGHLDVGAMQQAASYLEGTHDFSSFRSVGCQRASPVVTLNEIRVHAQSYGEPLLSHAGGGGLLGLGDSASNKTLPVLVTIQFVGNSFVYHQVRNMVGALVQVGRGSLPPRAIKDVLEARDRTEAPAMAPAHGLFLVDVQHDDIDF